MPLSRNTKNKITDKTKTDKAKTEEQTDLNRNGEQELELTELT